MEEQKKRMCHELARLVENALIDEVELAPKPGLVDPFNTGAHTDMDHQLFLLSAKTLTPYFEEMAQAAWLTPMTQTLRESIAAIGRRAEVAMLAATKGINTHKGAIWALGLFVSAVSSQYSRKQALFFPEIFSDIKTLVSFEDRQTTVDDSSHGARVKRTYGGLGAFGEATAGYPHVQIALADFYGREERSTTQKRLHMLLAIIASLEDTCILYRSDKAVLSRVQQLAGLANQSKLPNQAFTELHMFCLTQQVSPGGSADLLAVSLFLLSLEDKVTPPILIHRIHIHPIEQK